MIKVRCILCETKRELETKEPLTPEQESETYNIFSSMIAKSPAEEMSLVGLELVKHMQSCHMPELKQIAQLSAQWGGFNVMKYFETEKDDTMFETGKEEMRDVFVEEVMKFAPPEDDEEDSDFDNDLTDDESEDESDEDFDDEDCENDLTEDDEELTGKQA